MRSLVFVALVTALGACLPMAGTAQPRPTYTTLYSFAGYPSDGSDPEAALTSGPNGSFFGTNRLSPIEGTVYQLKRPTEPGGAWTENILHIFDSQFPDGLDPAYGSVIAGPGGVLYGTTAYGGGPADAGTVYQLTPPSEPGGSWTETLLYSFTGNINGGVPSSDGSVPIETITLGPNGVLYGTNLGGGSAGRGTIFQLTPPASPGETWTETVLYNFPGGIDGGSPYCGALLGPNGALYTATGGTVIELSPPATPGGAWSGHVIHRFTGAPGDGFVGSGNLVMDSNGVIYGVTAGGGSSSYGTVYSLAPPSTPGGPWTETVIHNFAGPEGADPYAGPILGPGGALFGATYGSTWTGAGGTIYVLAPPASPGAAWTLRVLHRFEPGSGEIFASLLLAPDGVLYGTTTIGGGSTECQGGCGTVFRLIP